MSNAAQSARLMWAAPSFIHFLDFGSGKQAFSTTELHMPQDHIRARQQLQDPRVPATQAEEAISSGQSLHHSATHCLEVGCRRSRGFMSGLPVTTSKTTQPKLHKSTALVNAACKATGPDTKFHSSKGRQIFCDAWLGRWDWACNCCPFSLRCRRFGWTVDRGLWTWKARCRL